MKNKFQRSRKIYVCIDANLPKIDDCGAVCEKHSLVLCRHHFWYPASLFYCNDFRFNGAKDSEVLFAFINFIKKEIKSSRASLNKSLFFIVTKDGDFLQDAEKEWQEGEGLEPDLEFLGDFVRLGNIQIQAIFITENDLEVVDYEKYQPRRKTNSTSRDRSQPATPKKDKDRWFRGGFRYAIITRVNKMSSSIFSRK